ncbi:hypothetical protein DYE50_07210 [Treponema ruminis]|uniref:DNA polymerase III epsilon subunit-like protein n=1 Tax=Treponema ruminis TaxID=744515 RepID=A0A7W8LLR9_9SPIR|nr:hypothetical protein [Treponema ruminis]MBB5225665.1 DNA polymerase III epsilon subunit-like protein [Treponema ruminis]QSI02354.1 hypothetical protein DYE50_07210 [Treponema ruminis]
MNYLFFDIECANCFNGIGKICSFGYVLCDENFSVIESDDLLMNPATIFDWYLFKKDSKCRLAYSREDYINNPKFPQHYKKIKSLLEASNQIVFGFGCQNDVATIATECIRYDLDLIDFNCHDIHTVLEKIYEIKGGLGTYVQNFGIDTEGMEFHDSKADAFFTMKVTEKLVKDQKKPISEILATYTPFSSKLLKKQKIKKLYANYLERKEAAKAKDGKPPRPLKKITVPAWFDYKRELLEEISLQGN